MNGLTPFFAGLAEATLLMMSRGDRVPDLLNAYVECDDFRNFNDAATDGDWVTTQATAGTADVIDGFGGLLQLDCNSATANQGIQVQQRAETFLPAAGKDLLFECRLKVTDTIDKVQLFAGLSVLDTSLFANGEMTSANYIGFILDATEQAGSNAGKPALQLDSTAGNEEKLSAIAPLTEDTFIRLGFFLSGASRLTPIVNGVPGLPLDITNCPATELAVSFACLSEGTNDPITTVDWYYAIQIR